MSRQQGLRVPPLRGRWCKGDYVLGTGGAGIPGGRAATELNGIGIGIVLESLALTLEHSTWCAQPLDSTLAPHWDPNVTPTVSWFGKWL